MVTRLIRPVVQAACGALLLLLLPVAAQAGWLLAETPHFRVHGDMPAGRLRDQALLLEDYRSLLATRTNGALPEGTPKLDVYLVGSIQQALPFSKALPGMAGFYQAGAAGIAAFASTAANGQQVLLHEYAHHHMFAAGRGVYPAWYAEGFAEYFSTASFRPKQVDYGLPSAGRLRALRLPWLAWNKVLAGDPGGLQPRERALFYAQSWLLTHYLFRAPGMLDRLRAYLVAVAAGTPSDAAFRQHVEADPARLTARLKDYLASKDFTFSRFDRAPPQDVPINIRPLSAAAGQLLLVRAALDSGGRPPADAAAALAWVRAAADNFPGDDLAMHSLALAEIRLGDRKAGLALVDELLARRADDGDLLRLRALGLLLDDPLGNLAAGQSTLQRAIASNPADWRAMHLLFHTHDLLPGPPADSLLPLAETMWTLAPQVAELRLDLAVVLARRTRWADAAAVLEPLANAVHNRVPQAAALQAAAAAADQARFWQVMAQIRSPPAAQAR